MSHGGKVQVTEKMATENQVEIPHEATILREGY